MELGSDYIIVDCEAPGESLTMIRNAQVSSGQEQ